MPNKSSDPSEAGINWESDEVAEHWSRNQARRDEHIGPATEMMLDLAGLQSWSPCARCSGWHWRTDFVGGSAGRSSRPRVGHRPFLKDAEIGSRHGSKVWHHEHRNTRYGC